MTGFGDSPDSPSRFFQGKYCNTEIQEAGIILAILK
jgi:hypothetical protein